MTNEKNGTKWKSVLKKLNLTLMAMLGALSVGFVLFGIVAYFLDSRLLKETEECVSRSKIELPDANAFRESKKDFHSVAVCGAEISYLFVGDDSTSNDNEENWIQMGIFHKDFLLSGSWSDRNAPYLYAALFAALAGLLFALQKWIGWLLR